VTLVPACAGRRWCGGALLRDRPDIRPI